MSAHYFWALAIPSQTKQVIHNQLEDVKGQFPFKRWVNQEDYHITFAFLGAAAESMLHKSINLVEAALQTEKAFSLQVQGLGVFGSSKSPRIFWASVKQEERLLQLQEKVFKANIASGFKLETRPFTPHITLARNWVATDFNQSLLDTYNPYKEKPIPFIGSEVVLYRTNVDKIPKYEPIATFSLISE